MVLSMIKRIKFYNFRGIREGTIELKPLTILIGANGSGKTTILESLLLTHGTRPLYGKDIFQILGELHETLTSKSVLHLIHKYGAKDKIASIEYDEDNKMNRIIIELRGDTLRVLAVIKESREEGGGIPILFAELNKYALGGKIYQQRYLHNILFIRDSLIKNIYRFIGYNWIDLSASGLTAKVAKSLSEIFDLDLTDILNEPFGGGSYALMVRLSDGSRIRLGDLGEGIQLLIVFSLLTEYMKPDLILWDDIESHMNPRSLVYLAHKLVDLVDAGKQVVVTTHSIEAARLLSGVTDKAKIIKLELDNGILKTNTLTYDELEKYLDLGIDVRI